MKKYIYLLPATGLLIILAFVPMKKGLVGNWKCAYGNNITGTAQFRSNGTYEATFDRSEWKIGGSFKENGNMVQITDTSCGSGYWAKYKMTWYTDDSAKITMVEDSCKGRVANADGAVFVRMK